MNEIERLLAEKEAAFQRVKREIEALRLSAALLAEPGDSKATQPETVPLPAPMMTAAPPPVRNGSAASHAHNREARVTAPEIFPAPRDGFIVCDGCGHRNPEFLLDCERCDLPIRLRP